jgi:hypothetical protein
MSRRNWKQLSERELILMHKAYIQQNWVRDGIDIFIVMQGSDGKYLVRRDGSIERLVEGEAAPEPTVSLSEEAARTLLDQLLQYYQGATDLHTVRGDLLHERGRVDKLLNTISELASRPQQLHVHKAEQ